MDGHYDTKFDMLDANIFSGQLTLLCETMLDLDIPMWTSSHSLHSIKPAQLQINLAVHAL